MFPRRIREGLELKLLEAQNDLRKQDVLLNETRTTLQQTEQKRREAQRVADAKTREKEDAQRKLAELKLSTTKPHIYNPSPELLTRLLESGTTAGENGHNNDTGPVQLLYPKPQSFTSESKPTFRWKAVPGASSYELYLYRVGTNDAPLKSPHETSNAWSIKTPLAPNSVYEWEVKAKKGDVVIARSSARFIVTPQ
jgi:hypothetical protein